MGAHQRVVGQQLRRLPVGRDHALAEDEGARAQLQGVRQVVRDHQDGDVQRAQDVGQFAAGGGVEVGGGLVEDEDLRLHRQYGRHRDPAPLAEGEVVRGPVLELRHADPFEGPVDALLQLRPLESGRRGTEGHVLADRRHEQLVVRVLEHDADPASDLGHVPLAHGQPGDVHGTRAAGQDAVEVEHEGRLAGAVRAEQRDPLAAREGEVHAEQGLVAVGVGEGQAGHFQRGCRFGRGGRFGHRAHPSRQTTRAAKGSARAYDHCARDAVTSSITGMEPAYPRLIMARCTRSPRS